MTFLQAPEPLITYKRITQSFTGLPNGAMPAGWSNRLVDGDAGAIATIWNGYVRAGQTLTRNENSKSITTHNDSVDTDNQIVRGKISSSINGLLGGLCLRMDATMMNGVMAVLSTDSVRGIWSVVNGVGTRVSDSFTATYATGETWALKVNGNVYSIIKTPNFDNTGGTEIDSWTDTGAIIKTGPAYRRGGFFLNSDRNIINTQNWGVGWNDFDFRDLGWTA